jgi:hypothetical protein
MLEELRLAVRGKRSKDVESYRVWRYEIRELKIRCKAEGI